MKEEDLKPKEGNDILKDIVDRSIDEIQISAKDYTISKLNVVSDKNCVKTTSIEWNKDDILFSQILNEMYETYKAKNHDYGSSASDTYNKFGLVSFLVRMTDKMNRLTALYNKESKVRDEKIEDTLQDLANYCVLALVELRRGKNNG